MNHVDKFILAHRPETMSTNTPSKTAEQNLDALFDAAFEANHPAILDWVSIKFRLKELEQALTGRTVSCAACNEMAEENRRLREALQSISSMPEYDQDDIHRLRHKAKQALTQTN